MGIPGSVSPPGYVPSKLLHTLDSYNKARSLVQKQDKFCAAVAKGEWGASAFTASQGEVPEDLQWEALADVIRGRVKVKASITSPTRHHVNLNNQVHNHCYEAVDLDGIVRVSNTSYFYFFI